MVSALPIKHDVEVMGSILGMYLYDLLGQEQQQ
jgi:hypothetical protein